MKKLNLLLATTAMLSMGAMVTNATPTTLDTVLELYAHVGMVQPVSATQIAGLEFGLVSNLTANKYVQIGVDSDTASGDATRIGNYAHRGMIQVSNYEGYAYDSPGASGVYIRLILPNEIRLSDGDLLCGYVDNLVATNDGDIQLGTGTATTLFYIGGKFTAKAKDGESFAPTAHNCTGHSTITFVVDEI